MPNYGEQFIKAMSSNGIGMNITAQVTDVKKPLISVQEMCRKGNRVIFKEHGPIIRNEIWHRDRDGTEERPVFD